MTIDMHSTKLAYIIHTQNAAILETKEIHFPRPIIVGIYVGFPGCNSQILIKCAYCFSNNHGSVEDGEIFEK